MNILFFAGRISYGGGEKVRNWLAKELFRRGHVVYYAIPDNVEGVEDSFRNAGILGEIIPLSYPYRYKKKRFLAYFQSLKHLISNNNIDLVIFFGGSLIEQVAAKLYGAKVLLSERFYNGFRPFASRVLKQIQYRIADGYVFQTPEASQVYGKRAEQLGVVIPNPIIDKLPDPQYDNLRKEIVTAGRLMPQKDHMTLIDAFALFHKKHSEYKLIIYGSGPLKEKLEDRIRSLGLAEVAFIISGKTNISELERGAELFVLSSLAEGMPNALIEAMSVGVQCISTDCPIYGSRMLITDKQNGFLVPVKDVNALSEAMCFAVQNAEIADMIRHNAVKIRQTLDENLIAKSWLNYISSITGR